jgi:NAD(P)-dependent dehydrogenase (short-subunit alcohol dehydrogenase family)
MARVLITGSADGLGRLTAQTLLGDGHEVIVHARSAARLPTELLDSGAAGVTGDLADLDQTRAVADQVNELGALDAVIHNAGVYRGRSVMPVNVLAPYALTALIERPHRLVYLSSGMHRGGRADVAGLDGDSYSDSKLFVTTLALAVARRWPEVHSNAVDPGWVPTRMGGPGAPDDLDLGADTQAWLAAGDDPATDLTATYLHHRRAEQAPRAAHDVATQDALLAYCAELTGEKLTPQPPDR